MARPSVIVSGGTYGIGRATSFALARAGFSVYAFGVRQSEAADSQTLAEGQGLGHIAFQVGDVRDEQFLRDLVQTVLEEHGQVDAVVNNAAIRVTGTVIETDPADWDNLFSVNVKGPYLLSRAALPSMTRRRRGAIVNVLSGAAGGKPNLCAYSATKGALLAMTRAMSLDFARQGVKVNGVMPGPTVTGVNEHLEDIDERRRFYGERNVAGRMNTPEDVAPAIVWLLSDQSANVTGAVLEVGTLPPYSP